MKTSQLLVKCVMIGAVVSLLGLGAAPAHADTVLWEQQPEDGAGGLYTSGGMAGLQYADDFEVDTDWQVQRLTWWGSVEGAGTLPDSFEFDITFFEDAGAGVPVATNAVASFNVSAAATATNLQLDLTNGSFGNIGVYRDVYEFSVEFVTPVALGPGTHYISIDSSSPDWMFAWMMSNQGNQLSWVTDNPEEEWASQVYDFAYRLECSIVPEPATISLMALGLAALAAKGIRCSK